MAYGVSDGEERDLPADFDATWRYPGARWWKFDFHAHTPASMDYGKGSKQSSLKQLTPRDWLLGFMRAKVDCVAVTDHNTGEWFDRLKEELVTLERIGHSEYRSLYLFPGVELSVNGGFHLLAIFDIDKTTSDIDSLIGAVEYSGTKGDSDGVTRKSAVEVVETVLTRGGIPIPAHADNPKGLLRTRSESPKGTVLDAKTVGQVLECQDILAMEVIGSDFDKPDIYERRNLAWAEVLGSDSHHPKGQKDQQFPGSHYTWVKMARPSLEGLRLALLDGGGFSLRRSDKADAFDPFLLPELWIQTIEIEEARYMGRGQRSARLDFNPWLNALIGGRGTGKSTVLHALRLAARRESDLEALPHHSESRETFERFNQVPADQTRDGGLTGATRIKWTLTRDGVRHRVYWRQQATGTSVKDQTDSGDWVSSSVQAVTSERFPLQIFSQGQIAELAGQDPTALLEEIDRAAGVGDLRADLAEAVAAFNSARARTRELESKLDGLQGPTTVQLQDVERKLARFETAGHTAILKSYRHRQLQLRELDRQCEAVEDAAQNIETTAKELQLEDLPHDLFDHSSQEDLQAVAVATILKAAVGAASHQLRDIGQNLRRIVESRREALKNSRWKAAVDEAEADYGELISSLEAEGVSDPDEFGSLVRDKQRLDHAMKDLQLVIEKRDRLLKGSQRLLTKVQEARRAITRARDDFLSNALCQNDFVRIEIRPYGDDPYVIERSLRQILNVPDTRFSDDILTTDGESSAGAVADLLDGLPEEPQSRLSAAESRIGNLKERFASTCGGQGSFGGHFNNYLARESDRRPELLDSLLTWFPEDGLSITYSRTGDGRDFQPISQASAGQRSAAMLAFLLAHGEEPLVLDQPEDDLDNHLIYDLIVRQIRENKSRRQIVVVTHNPNIVVNGDAEMVHALGFEKGQCIVKQSGSLQEEAIRDEVCRVMEGGREAFRRRYRRLG